MPPIIRVLREAQTQHTIKRIRQGKLLLRNAGGSAVMMAEMTLAALSPSNARQHFVKCQSEREDVAAAVGLLALQLFRRHVLEGSRDRALRGD